MDRVFGELTNKRKKNSRVCDEMITERRASGMTSSGQDATVLIRIKDREEIEKWIQKTKTVRKFVPGCRMGDKYYTLSELLPAGALVEKDGKTWVRLFHGTRSQNLNKLLRNGLKPVGGGTLGRGFYMTPVLEKAMIYTSKTQQLQMIHTFPIIIEILLPASTKVCCIDRARSETCCSVVPIFTDFDELWQFVCKDEHLLQSCSFEVWLV